MYHFSFPWPFVTVWSHNVYHRHFVTNRILWLCVTDTLSLVRVAWLFCGSGKMLCGRQGVQEHASRPWDQDPRFIESLSQICVLHRYLSQHCIFFANCRSKVPVGRVKTAANATVGWADVYIDTIWHHIEILHFKTSWATEMHRNAQLMPSFHWIHRVTAHHDAS